MEHWVENQTAKLDFGIVNKEAFTLVGIPVRAHWDALWTEMPLAWRKWFSRCDEVKGKTTASSIDASLAVRDGEYFQLIGTQVSDPQDVPTDMMCIDIPKKRYVFAEHTGPLEAIADSFGAMYRWAEHQGHKTGDFKLDIGYTASGKESQHQLYIELLD